VIGAQHKNIRRNVYECELAVMKQFPAFEYDFHLISGSQKAIEEQLPPEAQQIFSRSARDAI
jgi:hypothetical protein